MTLNGVFLHSKRQVENITSLRIFHFQVGALTVMKGGVVHPYDGDLTFVGQVLATLPVDVRVGKLLILGHVFGCLGECIVIG